MMIKYADFYLIKAEIETIERYMHDALWKMAEIYVIFPIFTISNTISRYELFHKSCIIKIALEYVWKEYNGKVGARQGV